MKIATPLKKVTLFPSNPPVKVEVLSSLPFLKIWLEAQPPLFPLKKGGSVPTMQMWNIARHFYLSSFWAVVELTLERTFLGVRYKSRIS